MSAVLYFRRYPSQFYKKTSSSICAREITTVSFPLCRITTATGPVAMRQMEHIGARVMAFNQLPQESRHRPFVEFPFRFARNLQ